MNRGAPNENAPAVPSHVHRSPVPAHVTERLQQLFHQIRVAHSDGDYAGGGRDIRDLLGRNLCKGTRHKAGPDMRMSTAPTGSRPRTTTSSPPKKIFPLEDHLGGGGIMHTGGGGVRGTLISRGSFRVSN